MTHLGQANEWQHFASKHEAMVEAVTAAHKATLGLLQSAQAKTESPEQKTILALGLACLKEFEEIVLLCGNGYGSGANKLLRTFFERVTTVGYLGKRPDKVQQFIDFTPVHWHKLLTEAEKKHEKVGLSEEEIAKIEADFEKVKGEYQAACTCGKKRLQGSWTNKPVPDMAEDVDMDLRLMYFNAFLAPTFLIHATYFGVMRVAGISESGKVHFFKPENEREMAVDTLSNAHLLLIIMGIAVNNFFKLEADGVLEGLGKDFERVCRIEHEGGTEGGLRDRIWAIATDATNGSEQQRQAPYAFFPAFGIAPEKRALLHRSRIVAAGTLGPGAPPDAGRRETVPQAGRQPIETGCGTVRQPSVGR